MSLQTLFLAVLFISCVVGASGECQRNCGGTYVPYPFGFGESKCSKDRNYELTCDDRSTPPILKFGNVPIINISVVTHTALIKIYAAFSGCTGVESRPSFDQYTRLGNETPFTFSSTGNRFITFGCNVVGYIRGRSEDSFASACASSCRAQDMKNYDAASIVKATNCSETGCCETPIPSGLKTLNMTLRSMASSNSCSYGFLVDPDNFKLTRDDHIYTQVVLDWAIGNTTCKDAEPTICGENASCNDSATGGPGYRCVCKKGYEGNPYEKDGCRDIDECEQKSRCHRRASCKNNEGSYTCPCPVGFQGDGEQDCRLMAVVKVVIGIGSCIVIAALVIPLCWMYKKRIQEANQRRNGGLLLEHLSVKIYKEEQLEKATNNYDSGSLLDQGGRGSVYMGKDENKTEIVVKKSNTIDQNTVEQFLNQVDIVSKINHKNVVKLLGICLETKVPLLVYEFIPGGTLYERIHGNGKKTLYSWPVCLKIAAETAAALDYMHSVAHPPIVHRDIKTKNILLHGTTAKVADFGASMLISVDQSTASRPTQGTLGYCDPEYLQTGELTVKSDVYGFGVVLMELLCKEKPLYRGVSGEIVSFVKVFTTAVEENRIDRVLKFNDVYERELNQVQTVANLAVKCVRMVGNDRPTMTEVADVLQRLCRECSAFQVEENDVEQVKLLGDEEFQSCFYSKI